MSIEKMYAYNHIIDIFKKLNDLCYYSNLVLYFQALVIEIEITINYKYLQNNFKMLVIFRNIVKM